MTEKILYQHGTLGALMAGLMDGTTSIAEILKHGTLGLGTLHGLDGEVIFLDGKAYQGRSDGALIHLSGEESTPYAAITPFSADRSFSVQHLASQTLKEEILKEEGGKNLFFAVKISGLFKNMHIRIMPKQEKPYRRLAKISESQPEFQQSDVQGTIVGFYTPELFQGVAAAGFHLHFIDEEKTFGGHILDFEISEGTVEISQMDALIQHFPTNDPTFIQTEIDYADLAAEIEQAE
ncbi:acetolactate decarboxylase [Enterococcus sp. DIV1298c]|uniref:Alpha-acetolactate decarboxylase n=1 Tax=Candidatus Enterococcus mangumiae TaxID=2230878 RepID=A0ABZ2T1Z6_9ENTE|nr:MULTISPECIES: acetolactate decarboxylase [unclassified Enterococcus]MBO0460835.1 acetolactate decarboxylase [Enterococcus sp. DIV1298c]MBO0491190.1 acetolactate decarboxylase [Enterococcus sp. DIV1094]